MSDAPAAFRVLVVDDDPDMGAYLGLLLKKEGMEAAIVEDGDAAMMRVMTDPPDLILLDVMMPGVSGFEICQRLKSEESTALIPIVLVTGLEDTESRVRGIESGADDFLSKPVKREELVARVKTLRPSILPSLEVRAVMKMIGMDFVSSSACRRWQTSMPSMSGIMTSSRIRSGRSRLTKSRASRPLYAARILIPSRSSLRFRSWTLMGWSSTTKMAGLDMR